MRLVVRTLMIEIMIMMTTTTLMLMVTPSKMEGLCQNNELGVGKACLKVRKWARVAGPGGVVLTVSELMIKAKVRKRMNAVMNLAALLNVHSMH